MNREAYRERLLEMAYRGRRALIDFVDHYRFLFSTWQREAIESAWDVGGIPQHLLYEFRSMKKQPCPPHEGRMGAQGSLAGEAIRSLLSPEAFWPRKDLRAGPRERERSHFDARTEARRGRLTPAPR